MKALFIEETPHHIDETVDLYGWVDTKRDHKKVVFIDLRDHTGKIQIVGDAPLSEVSPEDVVHIQGLIKKRPEHLINTKIKTGEIEVEVKTFDIISKSETLPFDFNKETLDVGLPTLLDYRALTLRHPKIQAIFKVQAALVDGFRKATKELKCIEVFVPTISASATEGGAELFHFDYFSHKAFLVQSPQLYKQMMVGVFERVFLISHIYRAEPSVTTRHLVESIQMDVEIGFIHGFTDLLDALEKTYVTLISFAQETCSEELKLLGVEPSHVSSKVPRLTMREAQQIIFERTGVDHRTEKDLMPEDEREIAKWALETHDSDLVTITHFPIQKRAFYTMPDPQNPEFSLGYDLLYKGLEISSGSQRIHNVNILMETIKERGLDVAEFYMYLQAFKYGMPPHGGFSFGLERSTMKLLNLENIREASLFPRDMERVDMRFSTTENSD